MGKVPDKIKFEDEDLKILDKFKDNLNLIRQKIDNQDINFYIDFIVNSLFETNKYLMIKSPGKKEETIRLTLLCIQL